MIATGFYHLKVPSLFIDIGANGDIVANVDGLLVATSSAAGAAMEGMNIECGCMAKEGTISGVEISDKGELDITIIGNDRPKGICGSGLVDIVAGLIKAKVILRNGKFAEGTQLPGCLADRLIEYQRQKAFLIDAKAKIFLTQKDIR